VNLSALGEENTMSEPLSGALPGLRRRPRWVVLTRVVACAGLTAAATLLALHAGGAEAATGPSSGGLFTITSVASGRYTDVNGASKADGASVLQYNPTGYTNQQWTTRSAGGGAYTIVNAHSSMCLAVASGATTAGTAIVQNTCGSGNTGQQWTFSTTSAGISTIRSAKSGLCLSVRGASTDNGAVLEQAGCTGATNQQWLLDRLIRVSSWGPGVNTGGSGFTNQTIRQVVPVSAGGTAPRVRLSNLRGSASLAVGHVDIAVQSSGGTAVAGTHERVTFGGANAVTLAAGAERMSDPVRMIVASGQKLLISVYVSGSTGASTQHPAAHETTYVSSAGDHAAEDGAENYPSTKASWYFLGGLDVTSTTATGTLVAIGDSITDGSKSTDGTERRYPDYLARRLAAQSGGPKLAVVNAGIGGNRVTQDAGDTYGISAVHRFSHDALSQTGVKDVIVLEGINDILHIGGLHSTDITNGYQTMIDQAHAAGVKIYGATLLPFGGNTGFNSSRETVRQNVNTWIRAGHFDGYFDFDAALRDPNDTTKMRAAYDSGDHLHPGDAGYEVMANAVNLSKLAY
jgi:lysophospholipase L1-like esterase